MIAVDQGGSTVMIHSLKMRGFIQDLTLAKWRATQLKPGKIQVDELSYQPEKLYTEALLEVLSKAIAEEINASLKSEFMACYEPAVQVHSCYLRNSKEKIDCNFDNGCLDLWLANETGFEKTKDKIRVAVKDKDLYLMLSELLRNVFFMDQFKAVVMKLVL